MSPRPDPAAWTCDIVPRGGRLLDLAALARVVHETSAQFTVRGVEATVAGRIVRKTGGAAMLEVSGTSDVLTLAPFENKVQLDVPKRRPQSITEEERAAYGRLLASKPSGLVTVIGPLRSQGGKLLVLEVRGFAPAEPTGDASSKTEKEHRHGRAKEPGH